MMASRPGAIFDEDYLENLEKNLNFLKNDLLKISISNNIDIAI